MSRVEAMKLGVSHRKTDALTRVEVVVVLSVLAILLAMLLSMRSHRPDLNLRQEVQVITCVENLKQIGLAYRVWEENHGDKYPMQTSVTNGGTMELANGGNAWINFSVMSKELSAPKILICPADTDKIAAANFTNGLNNNKISYFVGLDADETYPQMFLSGDDNFEISGVSAKSGLLKILTNTSIAWTAARHRFSGEIAFADGSVNPSSNKNETYRLTNFIKQTGLATNRLALP